MIFIFLLVLKRNGDLEIGSDVYNSNKPKFFNESLIFFALFRSEVLNILVASLCLHS